MKKKCLSAIVLAILLLCSFPVSGMAESDVPGGDEAEAGDGLGDLTTGEKEALRYRLMCDFGVY